MKKIIISIIIILVWVFGVFNFIKNKNIQQKILQTQEQIKQDKNKQFVDIIWVNNITQRKSYFESWKNLEINSMKINIKDSQNLDIYRPENYYTKSKNNDLLDKIWVNNFLNDFESWKIFLLIPINTFLWVTQDYSIYKEDLKDYFDWNIEKLLKNKTQEYWELVNFNQDYQEYLDNYKNNFEKYYEIDLEVNSNFSGTWEIYYYPYYDNHFFDWNNWVSSNLYENFVVDNSFYPYIKLAEINNKNAIISTINSYEKYFLKNNLSFKENLKKDYYKITYYNKKYVIKWNFEKWKNIIKINMFQSQTPKIWYIK